MCICRRIQSFCTIYYHNRVDFPNSQYRVVQGEFITKLWILSFAYVGNFKATYIFKFKFEIIMWFIYVIMKAIVQVNYYSTFKANFIVTFLIVKIVKLMSFQEQQGSMELGYTYDSRGYVLQNIWNLIDVICRLYDEKEVVTRNVQKH